MFEGTLQTMAFWMAAAGVTIGRDGWRFQPVRDEQYAMRCRGQATPDSKECVYELFVEEFHSGEDGENPKLFADLLVTVDGRKAFHCRRMGLELVPDYPLSSGASELDMWQRERPQSPTGKPAAIDYPAMLATAWGSPVQAFGDMYEHVNYTAHRAPRLPGPPYHFMTRVMEESGHGSRKVGSHVVVEYDVPPDAWYFAPDIGGGEMPFAVLLETGLQPCGWLATWVGCAVDGPEVFFRNLDGTGTQYVPITPETGTVSTHAKLTRVARSGGMTIVAFDVTMHDAAGTLLYDMDTMFGFFPEAALAEQAGIPVEEGELEAIEADVEEFGGLRDPWDGDRSRWDLLDRVAYWPDGGTSGLGRIRARFDVDPGDWFFQAHFYADPVQPGSIGLEAILEGVRWWAQHEGISETATLAMGAPHTWQYRGQVRPWNAQATAIVDIIERAGPFVVVDASLWCDGQKIYTFKGVRLELG
jgi:3-hydroxymyristoyl/3-hydroxydecanoyl-(acyl carrier protein) dehydratase